MNKVFLTGNLTRDVEYSETQSGTPFARFSIAVLTYKDNEKTAEFFNVCVWRGLAENCSKYLTKGSKVAVVGSLTNRSYEDKNGNKRTFTEIVANEVEFLSSSEKKEDAEKVTTAQQMKLEEVNDEDLPF